MQKVLNHKAPNMVQTPSFNFQKDGSAAKGTFSFPYLSLPAQDVPGSTMNYRFLTTLDQVTAFSVLAGVWLYLCHRTKMDKALPLYRDADKSGTLILSEVEGLVPLIDQKREKFEEILQFSYQRNIYV